MLKRILVLCLIAVMLLPGMAMAAPSDDFACLGNDLSASQREQMLEFLGAGDNTQLLTVTIEDERALLGGIVEDSVIGTRSISCARVRITAAGNGINVETHNINWVAASWYKNALLTAGVADADVIIAAPVSVSGTAALAGIFKAYESGTSTALSEIAKKVAGEELITTGDIAELMGTEQAAQLIAELKQRIVEYGLDTPEKMREAVLQAETEFGVTLTDAQREALITLLLNISKLDIDPEALAEQVKSLANLMQGAQKAQESVSGVVDWVVEAVNNVVNWFKGLFGG